MTINKKKKQRNITRYIRLFSLTGALFAYSAGVALAVPQNVTLPTGWQFVGGSGNITKPSNNIMNIVQNGTNAAIKWDSFSIGGNAIVNFSKDGGGNFNVLNYVNAGPVSEIYGTINATNGNVFVVNPAGVTIGKSAQINVGSLYVSNQKLKDDVLDDVLKSFDGKADTLKQGEITAGELMHLGYINAAQGKVTFVGDRIVLDADRIRDTQGKQLAANKINVTTKNKDNLVIGYNAYNVGTIGTFEDKNSNQENIATVNDKNYTKADGYMWIDNVQQLQAMNTNVSGRYALHNSIDAVETSTWTGGFTSVIGKDDSHNDVAFSGSFDGLGYNIFDLNIKGNDATTNVGLFAKTDGAAIKNINLVGGTIAGGKNVGAIVGSASNTTISNITTSANVTGKTNVGGIVGIVGSVGSATDSSTLKDLVNIGGITGKNSDDASFDSVNVGGIVGSMNGGKLSGSTYNIGRVTGGHEVGGLVGYAQNAALGDEKGTQIYNKMDISGGYNVGGIVGRMEGGTVVNAANYNSITATGATEEEYYYYGYDGIAPVTGQTSLTDSSLEYNGDIKQANKLKDFYNTKKPDQDGNKENVGDIANASVANVGGIAGSSKNATLTSVTNEGDIQSVVSENKEAFGVNTYSYYKAGNVGGIVGRAEDTIITDAANKENKVSGAHNVGGIAGYLGATKGNTASISNSVNNGGFIYGTGARAYDGGTRLTEWVRPRQFGNELSFIGNVGGIAGYAYAGGSSNNGVGTVSISQSGNRGTVSSGDYFQTVQVHNWSGDYRVDAYVGVANAGGIVGKLDLGNVDVDAKITAIIKGEDNIKNYNFAIKDSYNSGEVKGFSNTGGIAGMLYNGSVAGSYNLGHVSALGSSQSLNAAYYANMGGIIGSTTENLSARSILYDVYNDGIIGDSSYQTGGIHVGGIAGRLSGYMEQSYNTGDVYNIAQGTGGVMGALWKANIKNVFNAGNVTLLNKNYAGDVNSAGVGGIVGVKVAKTTDSLTNVYNIGVIRSFIGYNGDIVNDRINAVGGIIGLISDGTLNITNAYTRGEIYAGKYANGTNGTNGTYNEDVNAYIGAAYGIRHAAGHVNPQTMYYIKPSSEIFANNLNSSELKTDSTWSGNLQGATTIDTAKVSASDATQYSGFNFSYVNGAKKNDNGDWRIYDGTHYDGTHNGSTYNSGTTPILDCFRPAAVEYFGRAEQANEGDFAARRDGIDYIQYGTAYNPFMTIMYANDNRTKPIQLDFGDIGVSSKGGFAVYNGGLSITNFGTSGNQMFNGVIYSDGDLSIDTKNGVTYNDMSIKLGGASELYGSSVTLDTDKGVEIYGKIKATGNAHFKKLSNDGNYEYKLVTVNKDTRGDVIINGGDVEIYGHVSSAKANYKEENGSVTKDESGATQINGIRGGRNNNNAQYTVDNIGSIDEENHPVPDLGEFYAYKAGEYVESIPDTKHGNGSIKITATANEAKGTQGTVKAMLGSLDKGYLESFDAMEITGSDIYIDSDLRAGGNLTLDAATTVLDISNIGQVDSKDSAGSTVTSVQRLHNFLNNFSGENAHKLILKNGENGTTDAIIAADMWDDTKNAYDLGKYDLKNDDGTTTTTFSDAVYALNVQKDRTDGTELKQDDVQKLAHIWVENGEQLKGIQIFAEQDNDATDDKLSAILGKNFALKDDIDMFGVSGYKSIEGFTGNFDGRDNRIIGFGSGKAEVGVGIFKTIGKQASVKDVKIYNSRIGGTGATYSTGLLADYNNGTIENVTTFGNRVEIASGTGGGLVGTNSGTISNVTTSDIVTSQAEATLGGIVGTNTNVGTNNNQGTIKNVTANSAVVGQNAGALGGVVGENKGEILHAASTHGVISGLFGGADLGDIKEYGSSKNIGGVVGKNEGKIDSAYNDSYINGWNNIGGVIGNNRQNGNVKNIVNGSEMYGGSNIGGIVGVNGGTIDNGRNNGAIVADANHVLNNQDRKPASGENVGGLAGVNSGSMSNLVNDISAAIEGKTNVGGIIGLNQNFLSSAQNLMNQGEILGVTFVGGIVGKNGNDGVVIKVENTNDYTLGYNKAYSGQGDSGQGQFFGGIVGHNIGTVGDATNNATITVDNENVQYVGGIIGKNDGKIAKAGDTFNKTIIADGYLINNGKVTATQSEYVGGLIGENNGEISKTNLINSITGAVSGKSNVGGLIGRNTAEVKGGRDDGDNYYAYQVYNNGTVTGTDANVGGLVGSNDANGALSAGYNTGAISGGTNVGGVVGNNAANAKVDQVFNAGAVTGTAENKVVGTVVGYNNGTVKNAYDMTNGITNAVGQGNALSQEETDKWATYGETYGTQKLLKVFLTKLQFVPKAGQETALSDLVYDAQTHNITVETASDTVKVFKDGVEIGYFKPASGDQNVAHSLADYLNTNTDGLSSLLSGASFKDAGKHQIFNTQQIDTKGNNGNPNNLGFDVTNIKVDYDGNPPKPGDPINEVTVDKAVINLTLKDVYRLFGDANTLYKDASLTPGGEYSYSFDKNFTKEMLEELKNLQVMPKSDGAVNGSTTNAVGDYDWSLFAELTGGLADNYQFDANGSSSHEFFGAGKSHVVDIPADKPKFDDWEDKYSWYYGWDKKREERERKAEVHFVDGGMELN